MARAVKQRTPEDWADEAQRIHRMRIAADLDVDAGCRSPEWAAMVHAAADALNLLLLTSAPGEVEAISAAKRRLKEAA